MEDTELRPNQGSPIQGSPIQGSPIPGSPIQRSPLSPRTPTAAPAAHAPKAKPDARPMRVALGAGGIAALSALLAAIVVPARPSVEVPQFDIAPPPAADVQQPAADVQQPTPDPAGTPVAVQRPIQYIQLKPGETAPPGATVIDSNVPQPSSVVVTVPAPVHNTAPKPVPKATVKPAPKPVPKPIVIKTTQSGKVVP